MSTMQRIRSSAMASLLCLIASAPLTVQAQESDWQYTASINLWGAGIQGTTAGGSEVDVGFGTLLENLELAFMGTFEARKADWTFIADATYMSVGADSEGRVPAPPISYRADVDVKGWVLNFVGGYRVHQSAGTEIHAIAGARYLDLDLAFTLDASAGPLAGSRTTAKSGSVWDAIVGIRGQSDISGRWYVPYHFDIGTGESDLTWQVIAGIGYRFDWGDTALVYRHIDWSFDSGNALDDIEFSGPLLTARFHF